MSKNQKTIRWGEARRALMNDEEGVPFEGVVEMNASDLHTLMVDDLLEPVKFWGEIGEITIEDGKVKIQVSIDKERAADNGYEV